ncbi:SpoIIIAH-like family protein [Paenibacillus paeoniae]|uniref:SpoIIIAH-like family protein n=1 Tax=Paenibacillus paeoniae TaxID=2292705 RepID=A0A371PMB7_9BACL|nr:SpoIIIAH-like family protein [Paenibacillus paeoniae]REK77344.1 SpoIIIAH-like family protein [Paenibacillus paeoniae]
MNTKRQTIWLVSMLSLMVVLSAYYLFTQDLNDADKLSSEKPGENVTEVAGGNKGQVVVDEVKPGDDEGISVANQKILDQLAREGYTQGSIFSELLSKREQQYSQETDRIWSVLADVSNISSEDSAAAATQLDQLEDKNSRITALESELMKQYDIAIVSEENDRYKVVVTSEKLEKKDAASIIDQVMTVMEVSPTQVSVQYVSEP